MKLRTVMLLLSVFSGQIVAQELLREKDCAGDIYLSGLIVDHKNEGVGDADIFVFSGNEYVFRLKSESDGWFEVRNAIQRKYIDRKLKFKIFAKGYHVNNDVTHDLVSGFNYIRAKLKPIKGVRSYVYEKEYTSPAIHGYVYQKPNKKRECGKEESGVGLSVLKFSVKSGDKKESVLGKAITRASGYFDWVYPKEQYGKEIIVSTSHEEFNSESKSYLIGQESIFKQGLEQNLENWILGVGFQGVRVYESGSDKINNDTADLRKLHSDIVFNLTYFSKDVLIRDNSIQEIDDYRWGYDVSIGYSSLLLVDNVGDRGVKTEGALSIGVGLTLLLKNTDFMFRFGLLESEEGENGVYVGISVPIFAITKIFPE